MKRKRISNKNVITVGRSKQQDEEFRRGIPCYNGTKLMQALSKTKEDCKSLKKRNEMKDQLSLERFSKRCKICKIN
jgi:hypothetical protein